MINTWNQNNAQRTNNTNTEHDQNQKHNFEEQNKTQYKNNTKEEHIYCCSWSFLFVVFMFFVVDSVLCS